MSDTDSLAVPPFEPVTMAVVMDDVPPGKASEAVNNGRPAGDCLRACIATVLGYELDNVPHFVQYVEHPAGSPSLWWWALVGFCHVAGWEIIYEPDAFIDSLPQGWALAEGLSPRGHQHVCVAWNGEVVHDPHPSRSGLTEITGWYPIFKR